MHPNVKIIREVLEQVVNQKRIDKWNEYFSPDYIARGAPCIGMGFSRDTSGGRQIIDRVLSGSPAETNLQVGDELLWVEDERERWDSHDGISEGLRTYRGTTLKLGVRRGEQTLEFELAGDFIPGFDTDNDGAKSEMQHFMTREVPDLSVDIKMTLADGDKVVCLMEYRGTHASYQREALWREIWIARFSDGKIVESWPLPDVDAYCRQLGFQVTPPDESR